MNNSVSRLSQLNFSIFIDDQKNTENLTPIKKLLPKLNIKLPSKK